MGRKRKTPGTRDYVFGLLVMVGVFGGMVAFMQGAGITSLSQVAVGAAADLMCVGGADAKCPCGKGLKNGKCDPNTKGGGKIGCPCSDMTSGDVAASGKCATVGKCKADKADGMMPMLPMIPMPMMMPMMDMPMMQQPCTPKTGTTTNASSTDGSVRPTGTVVDPGMSNPDCQDQWGFGGGGFTYPVFDSSAYTSGGTDASADTTGGDSGGGGFFSGGVNGASIWGSLLDSLGISSGSESSGPGAGSDSGGGTNVSGSNAAQLQSNTGTTDTGTNTVVSGGFGFKSGSTFSYNTDINAGEVNGVLDSIATTLRGLLTVVTSWF